MAIQISIEKKRMMLIRLMLRIFLTDKVSHIFFPKRNNQIDYVEIGNKSNINTIIKFNDYLSKNTDIGKKIAAFYVLEINSTENIYNSLMLINLNNNDGSEVYLQYYYNNLINAITKKNINIDVNIFLFSSLIPLYL